MICDIGWQATSTARGEGFSNPYKTYLNKGGEGGKEISLLAFI